MVVDKLWAQCIECRKLFHVKHGTFVFYAEQAVSRETKSQGGSQVPRTASLVGGVALRNLVEPDKEIRLIDIDYARARRILALPRDV